MQLNNKHLLVPHLPGVLGPDWMIPLHLNLQAAEGRDGMHACILSLLKNTTCIHTPPISLVQAGINVESNSCTFCCTCVCTWPCSAWTWLVYRACVEISPAWTSLILLVKCISLWLKQKKYVNQFIDKIARLTIIKPILLYLYSINWSIKFLQRVHCDNVENFHSDNVLNLW